MKKTLSILLMTFILTTFSCSKNETLNQVGTWEGINYQVIKTDGIQTSDSSTPLTLTLNSNGSGNVEQSVGFSGKVHWVVDDLENKIYILSDYVLPDGTIATSTLKFDMVVNTDSEQTWERTVNFVLSTGEQNENFTRWSLLKK